MENLKVGDRVVLAWEEYELSNSPNNPVIGSKYFCAGTVVTSDRPGWITVAWDNGTFNYYEPDKSELMLEW